MLEFVLESECFGWFILDETEPKFCIISWGYCVPEICVRISLIWVDYLGLIVLKSRGLVFRIDWSMGQGLLEYSSFSGFYSDYLSEFRF